MAALFFIPLIKGQVLIHAISTHEHYHRVLHEQIQLRGFFELWNRVLRNM